jgi:hypothetical protein
MCKRVENSETLKQASKILFRYSLKKKKSGLPSEVDAAFDRKATQSEGSYRKQTTDNSRAIYSSSGTVHLPGVLAL